MRRVRRWAWLGVASALLVPQVARARVPTRLVYARAQSAKDCPDEQALVDAVAARLGYDPFSPWGDQTILATVSRAGSSVLGRAELIDHDGIAQGSREVKVEGGQCTEAVMALSLAISITLDPLHVAAPPVEADPVTAPPEPPPIEQTPASPSLPVAEVARRDVPRKALARRSSVTSWHVRGGALTAYALAPRVAFGARLGLELRRARWSLSLEGWTALPTAREVEGGGRVQTSLWAAAIAPCFTVVNELRLCALGSAGSLRSESTEIAAPRAERVLHVAAGGRLGFDWPVSQNWELVATADVAAALNRPRFLLDGAEVWRPSPVWASLGIGASARFF